MGEKLSQWSMKMCAFQQGRGFLLRWGRFFYCSFAEKITDNGNFSLHNYNLTCKSIPFCKNKDFAERQSVFISLWNFALSCWLLKEMAAILFQKWRFRMNLISGNLPPFPHCRKSEPTAEHAMWLLECVRSLKWTRNAVFLSHFASFTWG